jgi:hypothetical protein
MSGTVVQNYLRSDECAVDIFYHASPASVENSVDYVYNVGDTHRPNHLNRNLSLMIGYCSRPPAACDENVWCSEGRGALSLVLSTFLAFRLPSYIPLS